MAFFKNLADQFINKWHELELFPKIVLIASVFGIFALLITLISISTSSSYVPLFSGNRFEQTNLNETLSYLKESGIPFIQKDNGILVPANRQQQIRTELATYKTPKVQRNKGFELFDNNTWIKGEKELQVLEVRALQGELEQDITQFDNVQAANVILDMPPPRPFGGSNYKAKASVILTLNPGSRIGAQELRAITFHVSGAVRGLTPNMIAISDTNGKLYQSIDPDGEYDFMRNEEIATEEYIKAKIDGMLTNIVGPNHFFSTVQVVMNREKISQERKIFSGTVSGVDLGNPVVMSVSESDQKGTQNKLPHHWLLGKRRQYQMSSEESKMRDYKQLAVPMDYVKITTNPGKIESISIGVLVDPSVLKQGFFKGTGNENESLALLKANLESQIATILKGYNVKVTEAVNFAPFNQSPPTTVSLKNTPENHESNSLWPFIATILGISCGALITAMYFLSRKKQFREEQKTFRTPRNQMDLPSLEAMVESLRNQIIRDPAPLGKAVHKWLHKDS